MNVTKWPNSQEWELQKKDIWKTPQTPKQEHEVILNTVENNEQLHSKVWEEYKSLWEKMKQTIILESNLDKLELKTLKNEVNLWIHSPEYIKWTKKEKNVPLANDYKTIVWNTTKYEPYSNDSMLIVWNTTEYNPYSHMSPFMQGLLKKIFSFDGMFNALEKVDSLNNKETEDLIRTLQENSIELRKNLKKDLLEKIPNKENKEQLVNTLLDDIFSAIEEWELKDVYLSIQEFNKENEAVVDMQRTASSALLSSKANAQKTFLETSITSSPEESEEILVGIMGIERNIAINNALNNEQIWIFNHRSENWENFDDIIRDLSNTNPDLKQALDAHNEKYKDYYEYKKTEKKESEKTVNNQTTNIDKPDAVNEIPTNEYSYNPNTWIASVMTNSWKKENISLDESEKKLVQNNPEILKNIVDFYKVLDEIWLSELWEIKDSIFTSISNVLWVWFNTKEGYLNTNETKLFLNSILKSVWEKEISLWFSIGTFIEKFKRKNWLQFTWETKDIDSSWDSKLWKRFRKKFYTRWSAIWFKNTEFEKTLRR